MDARPRSHHSLHKEEGKPACLLCQRRHGHDGRASITIAGKRDGKNVSEEAKNHCFFNVLYHILMCFYE